MGNINGRRISDGITVLSEITDKLKYWDYQPVSGIGFFRKAQKYGHIEVTLTPVNEYGSSKIVWQIEEYQIPHNYREDIESNLILFINFLNALQGKTLIGISIEIINGSFHPTDSHPIAYDRAVFYALRNCFDKDFGKLTPEHESFINAWQVNGLTLLKKIAIRFNKEQILTSLTDIGLNNILRSILINKNPIMLEYHAKKFSSDIGNIISADISDEVLENLKLGHIISKYNDLTYIGWAHLGIILKQKSIFKNIGITDLSTVRGYYDTTFI